MINRISGKLIDQEDGVVVVSCGGVGFELCVTSHTQNSLQEGSEVLLHTYLSVKEDSMTLFGFSSVEEKQMFLRLISISGIGPKMALSILSGSSPQELALAIVSGNVSILSKIKGVGKKTAERIVLELKEKLEESMEVRPESAQEVKNNKLWQEAEDAVFGLRSLGIREAEATKIVQSVAERGMTAEEIITKSLRGLAK